MLRPLLPLARLFYPVDVLVDARQSFLVILMGVVFDLFTVILIIVQRSEQLADDAVAHALIRPQTLVLVAQLLLQVFLGAGVEVLVHFQQLGDQHLSAQLGGLAEQAIPIHHGDVTLLFLLAVAVLGHRMGWLPQRE